MKKSQVLRAAVRECLRAQFIVADNRVVAENYLCNALCLYADMNPKARPAASDIQGDIRRLLYPYSSVQTWVREALNLDYDYRFSLADLYAYRKRWAEHMAQQYEAQGD